MFYNVLYLFYSITKATSSIHSICHVYGCTSDVVSIML